MPIEKLSPLLVNQIAAGEVIERPASVVKELVENSLDAGAERIDVRVEEGGRQRIRVADDGCGIPADQLALALAPHATSKIRTAEDLAAIHTMGFRGEALASIASISRFTLTSRPPQEPGAMRVHASGDRVEAATPVASAPGTVIDVSDLFFNTPARRKFMRGAATEFGHVNDLMTRLAIAHPDVGFSLTHNEKLRWEVPAGQTPAQRCVARIGGDVADGLLEFASDEQGVRLWGMAGLPTLARPTAKAQYIYVNGRPVRDRSLAHAIKEAYRGLAEPHRHPLIVLSVWIDAEAVDVNVHPTKAEVRFRDGGVVHKQVLAAVRQRLADADLTPTVPVAPGSPVFSAKPAPVYASSIGRTLAADPAAAPSPGLWSEAPGPAAPAPIIQPTRRDILQVHGNYILVEDPDGVTIIDQHALHERMMFQTLLDRVTANGELESQRLVAPAVFEASPSQIELLDPLGPLLSKIGVEASAMGPEAIAVHAFATLLFNRKVEPVAFMRDLLDRAEEEGFEPSTEAALHAVLDMMSCKAAVKAGDRLSQDELAELLQRRDAVERSSNCPHGRPTTVRLTLRDLERFFKRG